MSHDSAPRDRGGLLGEGLFETLLLLDGRPPHLDRHLARLRRSAEGLALPLRLDAPAVERAIAQEWDGCGRPGRAAARLTVALEGPPGLLTTGAATRTHVGVRELPNAPERAPWRAALVATHRVDPGARISGHKTLSWLPWVLARAEARERGADIALVATIDGDVCEADHANLFAVLDDVVVTPPLSRGVLPGITRARVLRTLADHGRPHRESVLTAADLRCASEIFVSSSLDGVRAVGEVDGAAVAAPGPVAAWLDDCVPVR